MEKLFASLVCTVLIFPRLDGSSTVELAQGDQITTDIIDENPQRIVVDLGFTVLAVTRASISRIYGTGEETRPGEEYGRDFYRIDSGAATFTIKELAVLRSEAVVLMRTPTGQGSGFVIHPHFDLALLKIEDLGDRRLETTSLGQSDTLRQGQSVFTIGSPIGLEGTVPEGIVSIRNRLVNDRLFIQTTAQINPGNSGGPLLNMRGELVGVNNIKVVAQGAEGLDFAIPSPVLKTFLRNRDAFAFDPRNSNCGYRDNSPPRIAGTSK